MATTTRIQTSLLPFLVVSGASEAISFYVTGFGATVVEHFEEVGGNTTAKLSIMGAEFYIGDEEPRFGNLSATTLKGSPVRLILIVEDPANVFNKAVQAGATAICPVTHEESWVIGKLSDPFGHTWEIGHPLNNA